MSNQFDVTSMSEGEILVRGTLDPNEALKVVFEQVDGFDRFEERAHGVFRGDHYVSETGEVVQSLVAPDKVSDFADYLHEMLAKAITGYHRKVHCLDNSYGSYEGWSWALHPAEQGRRGAFPAVEFLP